MEEDTPIKQKIDDNEVIWRYMDFASFYLLLLTKGLFFRRLDKYSDQYEGTLPDEVKEYLIMNWASLFGIETANEMLNHFTAHLKELNSGTLSNSWVASHKEIYAMWKIYLRGSQEGIAIRSTVGKLKDSLAGETGPFTLAKISYEILPWAETDYRTLAAYKSMPYSYESELRVLVYNQFEESSVPLDVFPKIPLYEHGKSFQVETEKLIDEIYISPFAGSWFYDVIKSTIMTFIPSFDIKNIIGSRIKDI